MSVIESLIRTESDGSISFGNYELGKKTKLSDFKHEGDFYKVKTFKEITRLERNEMFVFESVPGTAVHNLKYTDAGMEFSVEAPEDVQITIEAEPETNYDIYFDGEKRDTQKTSLGGKLAFSVEIEAGKAIKVAICKA